MFAIGEFARLGRVSVRMLRHYDALGLLCPAHVDPATGYRSYEARQLSLLNRIHALNGLGFTLHQVGSMLDDSVNAEQLRGMLRLRRAEIESRIDADAARLADVEARLWAIEADGAMPADDVQIKRLPPLRVAELTGTAATFEPASIAPVIGPLYATLQRDVRRAELTATGPGVAHYEQAGEQVLVHATIPVAADLGPRQGFAVVDLPEIDRAATIVHNGSMAQVLVTLQTLARWMVANGHRSGGYNRELYLETPDDKDAWVTELQEPLR